MNEQTRYVMAIYQLGAVIRDTLEYLLPPGEKGYSVEVYNQRKAMINHLVEPNSPFALFCQNNKGKVKDSEQTIGERISSQVHQFVDDVYGPNSTLVKIDHDKISVETSLSLQLMDYIVGLHETISDVCLGFKASFAKEGTLDNDFDALLTVDDPFYRSVAFRAVAVQFVTKFTEFNQAVNSYVAAEREKNGIDPTTQPGFDPKVDPSCAFISNEMGRVVGFYNFLKAHNKAHDVIFLDDIERMQDTFHYFDGSKKLAEGQKMGDVLQAFQLIFSPVIPGYRDAWVKAFTKVFSEVAKYEQDLIAKRNAGQDAAAPAAAPVKEDVKPVEEPKKD